MPIYNSVTCYRGPQGPQGRQGPQGYQGNDGAGGDGLGDGQTWESFVRYADNTYYNTTSKPIALYITLASSSASYISAILYINSVVFLIKGYDPVFNGIIPVGSSYRLTTSTGFSTMTWRELR
jgi:hypothetical protein